MLQRLFLPVGCGAEWSLLARCSTTRLPAACSGLGIVYIELAMLGGVASWQDFASVETTWARYVTHQSLSKPWMVTKTADVGHQVGTYCGYGACAHPSVSREEVANYVLYDIPVEPRTVCGILVDSSLLCSRYAWRPGIIICYDRQGPNTIGYGAANIWRYIRRYYWNSARTYMANPNRCAGPNDEPASASETQLWGTWQHLTDYLQLIPPDQPSYEQLEAGLPGSVEVLVTIPRHFESMRELAQYVYANREAVTIRITFDTPEIERILLEMHTSDSINSTSRLHFVPVRRRIGGRVTYMCTWNSETRLYESPRRDYMYAASGFQPAQDPDISCVNWYYTNPSPPPDTNGYWSEELPSCYLAYRPNYLW